MTDRRDDLRSIADRAARDALEESRAREQIAQAQRIDAIGQLTGSIAHDFNNLLTVILGHAELLLRETPNDERSHRLAEMILAAAERGTTLTRQLLAFGRRQVLVSTPIDVNALLGDMEELFRRTPGEPIDVRIVKAERLWTTTVDRGQFENAVLNLVVNARDAMPDGGRITIETSNVEMDETGDSEVMPGHYVQIAISDAGEGMSKEVAAKAFDPFFTTRDPGKATGLGLSMVRAFVRQSGGYVKICSELGRGTVVRLYLPRSDDDPAAAGADALAPVS